MNDEVERRVERRSTMASEWRDVGPGLGCEDLGEGEPALLLLTGWCSSRGRWARAAPLLAANHRVVSFDWRGHGDSAPVDGDFGSAEMVHDALAVVDATGLQSFIPCSASHSGWVAIELARRLGARVPAIAHMDWMVTEPSPAYMELILELQSEWRWRRARDKLFEIWRAGDSSAEIAEAIAVMKEHDAAMWMRSGREIDRAYHRYGSPLKALSALDPPPKVLHLYGQPAAPEYLAAQRRFVAEHGWFSVRRVDARTHFSMLERPTAVAAAIHELAAASNGTA